MHQMSRQLEPTLESRGEAPMAKRGGEAGRAASETGRSGSDHHLLMAGGNAGHLC